MFTFLIFVGLIELLTILVMLGLIHSVLMNIHKILTSVLTNLLHDKREIK